MSRKNVTENQKSKPRGRPFKKKNVEVKSKPLTPSECESNLEKGILATSINSAIVDPASDGITTHLHSLLLETLGGNLKECEEIPLKGQSEAKKEIKELEAIESLDFKNGENTLSIRFSKRHNRMFRIQVFLNNENEIRPVTYTGAHTGYAFWNLLKGALKK